MKEDNLTVKSVLGVYGVWQILSALVSAALSSAVVLYGYTIKAEGVKSLLIAGIGVFSTILVLIGGCLIALGAVAAVRKVKIREEQARADVEIKKSLAEARLAAEKAMAFDYKMYAPIESESVSAILQHCSWDLDKLHNKEVKHIDVWDANYISLKTLLDGGTAYGSSFQCLPVRNDEKWGKCIIQVSFIPMDRDGNIPIILRMPNAHSRDAVMRGLKETGVQNPKFTFVSFSPVPMCFGKTFDLLGCYKREVPNRIDESQFAFEEVGCTMKYECDGTSRRIYLFYVIAVHYQSICFIGKDGTLDMNVIKGLFAVDPAAPQDEIKFFRKDHDVIIAAASPGEIYNALSADGNKEVVSESVKRLFANSNYVVRSMQRDFDTNSDMIFEDHFDLSKGKLGEVELAHIQRMRM